MCGYIYVCKNIVYGCKYMIMDNWLIIVEW